MDDGDVVGVLSDFFDLVFEVKVGQLVDVALLVIINGFRLGYPEGQNKS